jgi:hypothetical protein
MADTSWHGVHPWSWHNNDKMADLTSTHAYTEPGSSESTILLEADKFSNTKHLNMTKKETKEDTGDPIAIPETQETATLPCKSMDPEVTGRQTIDRLAELDFRTEEQLETPTYTDTTPTDSTLKLVANKLSKATSTVMVITFSTQNCAQAGSQGTRPLPHMNLNVSERLICALWVCHGQRTV